MTARKFGLAMATLLAGASLLTACDKSKQTADGATGPGQTGTAAATGDGTVASTGSPEMGGAGGTPSDKGVQSGMSTAPNGVGAAVPPDQTAPGAPASVHADGA